MKKDHLEEALDQQMHSDRLALHQSSHGFFVPDRKRVVFTKKRVWEVNERSL